MLFLPLLVPAFYPGSLVSFGIFTRRLTTLGKKRLPKFGREGKGTEVVSDGCT